MEWCLLTLSTEKHILTRSAAAFEEADHATIDLMTVVLNHLVDVISGGQTVGAIGLASFRNGEKRGKQFEKVRKCKTTGGTCFAQKRKGEMKRTSAKLRHTYSKFQKDLIKCNLVDRATPSTTATTITTTTSLLTKLTKKLL